MKKNSLKTRNFKKFLLEILFLSFLVLFFFMLIRQASINLSKQGIASGFSFLKQDAGFSIIQTLISYSESSSYLDVFWVGILNTCLISFLGIFFASILGFSLGIARLSKNLFINKISLYYIETVRNIPLLLQIFFYYFVVLRSLPLPKKSWNYFDSIFLNNRGLYLPYPETNPLVTSFLFLILFFLILAVFFYIFIAAKKEKILSKRFMQKTFLTSSLLLLLFFSLNLLFKTSSFEVARLTGFNFEGGLVIIPELIALLLGLSLYTASFIAEIVRAGLLSVDKGQKEAARALGLSSWQQLRFVTIPQAFRLMIPPLASQYLNLTKNSSLAVAIGYPDLVAVFAGTSLNQTGQAIEVILMTMCVYLSLSLSISFLMNIFNKHYALKGNK